MAHNSSRQIRPRSIEEIKNLLQQHKPELSEKWKVKSLGIFGSYVRGEARKSSDLDLLVEIDDPKMGLLRFIALENYLSDLLGIKVDLVEKQALKPNVGRHVTNDVESVFSMDEDLESKEEKPSPFYESDQDMTDEKIAGGLMEITALSLADVLESEPDYE